MKTLAGKVLVVDDEEAIRAICVKALTTMGLDVEWTGTGEEAWRLVNERGYDCVLTDITMPGSMDGAALTAEIRSRFPSTDMLVMTGDPSLTTAVATLKRGALDYLIKPFSLAALESTVARCFERRRMSDELDKEKILRRELEAAYVELQKTERSKDAFISVLNHELRTPLTIAVTAAEMLKHSSGPEQTEKILAVLRSSLARENEVVDDLLLFSSLSASGLQVGSDEFDQERLIRELVEEYRSVWEERNLTVEMRFGKMTAPLRGDPVLLRTAFKHLLLNAVFFNLNGGRVLIESKEGPGRLDVTFADTGIGIAPAERTRVFDRFYQVAEHMTRKVGGLGLGLAIVRRIIEAHGGCVTVAAHQGGGSEFLVSLPRRKAPSMGPSAPDAEGEEKMRSILED